LARQAAEERLEGRVWLYYCSTVAYQDKKHATSFEDMMKKLRLPKQPKEATISKEQLKRFDNVYKFSMKNKAKLKKARSEKK